MVKSRRIELRQVSSFRVRLCWGEPAGRAGATKGNIPAGLTALTSLQAGKPLWLMRGLPLMMRAALVFLLGMAMETGLAEEPAAPEAGVKWADQRKETFEIVWKTVDEAYFDPTFGGVDWAGVGEKYRARLETAEDKPALRKLLQSMIGELRKTHFS